MSQTTNNVTAGAVNSAPDVLRIAREQIAKIAGVRVDAVTLELKIGA